MLPLRSILTNRYSTRFHSARFCNRSRAIIRKQTQTMTCVAVCPHRRWTPRPFFFSPCRCCESSRYGFQFSPIFRKFRVGRIFLHFLIFHVELLLCFVVVYTCYSSHRSATFLHCSALSVIFPRSYVFCHVLNISHALLLPHAQIFPPRTHCG